MRIISEKCEEDKGFNKYRDILEDEELRNNLLVKNNVIEYRYITKKIINILENELGFKTKYREFAALTNSDGCTIIYNMPVIRKSEFTFADDVLERLGLKFSPVELMLFKSAVEIEIRVLEGSHLEVFSKINYFHDGILEWLSEKTNELTTAFNKEFFKLNKEIRDEELEIKFYVLEDEILNFVEKHNVTIDDFGNIIFIGVDNLERGTYGVEVEEYDLEDYYHY